MDYKKLFLSLILGLFLSVSAFGQQRVKYVSYKTALKAGVKTKHPDASVVDMPLGDLNNVSIIRPLVNNQCIAWNGSNFTNLNILTQENIYPACKAILKAGTGVGITEDDSNSTLTISATGTAETASTIKTKLETLTGNDRLSATAIKDLPTGGSSKLIALETLPTDFSSYDEGQVLRIKTPSPGQWIRVIKNTDFRHALKLNTGLDTEGNNVTNVGVNLVGTGKLGSVETQEGSTLTQTTSPLLRAEFQADLGGPGTSDDDYNVQVLIRKSALTGDDLTRGTLHMALYDDVPSSDTFVDIFPLAKQASDVTEDGIVTQEYILTINQARYNAVKAQHDADAEIYVEFYTDFTTYSDKGDVVNILKGRTHVEIDIPDTGDSIVAKLTALTGSSKLSAGAIRDLPTGGSSSETGATIKSKLENLTGEDRLDATAIRNLQDFAVPKYITDVVGTKARVITGNDSIQRLSISSGSISARRGAMMVGNAVTGLIMGGRSSSSALSDWKKYDITGNTIRITNLNVSGVTGLNTFLRDAIGNPTEGIFFIPDNMYKYSVSGNNVVITQLTKFGSINASRNFRNYMGGSVNGGIIYNSRDNRVYKYVVSGSGNSVTFTQLSVAGSMRSGEIKGNETEGIIISNSTPFSVYRYSVSNNLITITTLTGNNIRETYSNASGFKVIGNDRSGIIFSSLYVNSSTQVANLYNYEIVGSVFSISPITYSGTFSGRIDFGMVGTSARGIIFGGLSEFPTVFNDFYRYNVGTQIEIDGVLREKGTLPLFEEDSVDFNKQFTSIVRETTSGTKQDKNLALASSGSNYTIATPFPGILRLTFNADSSESDLLNRYSVNVALLSGDDSNPPTVLQIGTTNHSLSYYETDSGVAVYRTPVIATSSRVTSATTINSVNIQLRSGEWVGQSGTTTALKTLTKEALQAIANKAIPVHDVPSNPTEGMRIEPLNDISTEGCAVLTADEFTSSTANYIGYLDASSRTQTTDLGSLVPENNDIAGLLSYPDSHNSSIFKNKTVFQDRGTYNPTTSGKVVINGTEYAITNLQSNDYWALTGLDGSFIKDGEKYCINVKNGSGTPLYPNVTLIQGVKYFYDGLQWQEDKRGLDQEEVDNRIQTEVPQQFRSDADTTGGYFQKKCWWKGTDAEYTALNPKIENCEYNR